MEENYSSFKVYEILCELISVPSSPLFFCRMMTYLEKINEKEKAGLNKHYF